MKWANIPKILAILLAIVVFGLVLSITGCSIESPKAPSWDVPITIPLIDRSYTSAELLEKISSENVEIADDGSASFVVRQDLENVGFGSILQFDDVNETHAEQIGLIKILPASNQDVAYRLEDYVSLIAGVVPETGATAVADIGQPSSFSRAEIASGTLGIQVSNNTGLALDQVTITLRDNDGVVVVLDVIGGLTDGEQYYSDVSVAGKTMNGNLTLETFFHTIGGSLLSLSERSLDLRLSYGDDLRASSVTGVVDRFDRNYYEETSINEESTILSATLQAGSLVLDWSNDLPVPIDLDLTFPDITDGSGQMHLSISLQSNQKSIQTVSLQGRQISPVSNKLAAEVIVAVEGSDGGVVTMTSSDQFSVEISLTDLQAETASAILQPTDVTWDQTLLEIDVPSGFENVSPALVELEIVILNYSELSGDVQLELQTDGGEQLTVTGQVAAGSANAAVESTIYSSQLADLLSPIPDRIFVSGMAVVGDGATAVSLNSTDHLEASATISAPMSIILDDATVEGDPNELRIDEDLADKADRLIDGRFQGRISNHLPLGASVSIYFSASEQELFSNPITIIGPFTVNAGEVDGSGIVSQLTETDNEINLSSSDLAVFGNEHLYIAPVIELHGSNGEIVHIRAQDFLDVSCYVTINTRLGGEEF